MTPKHLYARLTAVDRRRQAYDAWIRACDRRDIAGALVLWERYAFLRGLA
jgi:hypothetical protein